MSSFFASIDVNRIQASSLQGSPRSGGGGTLCRRRFAAKLYNLYMPKTILVAVFQVNLGDSHQHSFLTGAFGRSIIARSIPSLPPDLTITPCEHICLELLTIIAVHFKLCVPVSHLKSSEHSLGPMAEFPTNAGFKHLLLQQ